MFQIVPPNAIIHIEIWHHFLVHKMIFLDLAKSLSLNTLTFSFMWEVPITYAYVELFIHYCMRFASHL